LFSFSESSVSNRENEHENAILRLAIHPLERDKDAVSAPDESGILGHVRSLHVHPDQPGAPMMPLTQFHAVAGRGLEEDGRYYGRISRSTGEPSHRQITLIAREEIAAHAQSLGIGDIPPGAVRANIETEGVDWVPLVGQQVQVGQAVLLLYEARTPCAKMDAVCAGLRRRMEGQRQGVLAQVVQSGQIAAGDPIRQVGLEAGPLEA
jgi:hypothetical protein